MRVMNIIHDSVVDGEGLRTAIFFSGCSHHCKGCHNPQSWKYENGKEMTVTDIINEIKSNPICDVTLSGGDPFYQTKEIITLVKEIKKLNKNIWIYSGYTLEEILVDEQKKELLSYCDVLVDGKFILEQRDLTLKFRGSRNQRIININELNLN